MEAILEIPIFEAGSLSSALLVFRFSFEQYFSYYHFVYLYIYIFKFGDGYMSSCFGSGGGASVPPPYPPYIRVLTVGEITTTK